MNTDLPGPDSREALEAKLTARLLGELSPEEDSELAATLAADPELARLEERLRRAAELVRETTVKPSQSAGTDAELPRMSPGRRVELLRKLAGTKPSGSSERKRPPTVIPVVFEDQTRSRSESNVWLALAACLVALFALVSVTRQYEGAGSILEGRSATMRGFEGNQPVGIAPRGGGKRYGEAAGALVTSGSQPPPVPPMASVQTATPGASMRGLGVAKDGKVIDSYNFRAVESKQVEALADTEAAFVAPPTPTAALETAPTTVPARAPPSDQPAGGEAQWMMLPGLARRYGLAPATKAANPRAALSAAATPSAPEVSFERLSEPAPAHLESVQRDANANFSGVTILSGGGGGGGGFGGGGGGPAPGRPAVTNRVGFVNGFAQFGVPSDNLNAIAPREPTGEAAPADAVKSKTFAKSLTGSVGDGLVALGDVPVLGQVLGRQESGVGQDLKRQAGRGAGEATFADGERSFFGYEAQQAAPAAGSDESNLRSARFRSLGDLAEKPSANEPSERGRRLSRESEVSRQDLGIAGEATRPGSTVNALSWDAASLPANQAAEPAMGLNKAEPQVRLLNDQLALDRSGTVAAGKAVSELRLNLEQEERDQSIAALPSLATAPVPTPEVLTAENAFSTFSMNVSDVSFKLAAASLENGALPEPANVRVEEFLNALPYRDPEPAANVPVSFAWERAQFPFAQQREALRLAVRTAASGRETGRPLNIVLVLDSSGSMERADRVRIVREALRVLATQIRDGDRVSVVAFARTARLWVDGLPGNQAGELVERVGNLTPEGGTNLEDALRVGYETALKHFLADGGNRVVILTDGAANLGDVRPETLKLMVESYRRRGVALDCFGIGWEGYHDELLEALARNGDGRYGFVNSPEEAGTQFAAQLAGALQVAASDVKVQVEFNPRRVSAWRQVGYAKHQLTAQQFRDNTVDAAEIGAAESGNALYVIATEARGEGPLGTVRVRFRVPSTDQYTEHEWTVPYLGTAVALENASPALRLAVVSAAFGESLANSPFAGEVTDDRLLRLMGGLPDAFRPDPRPGQLEAMIRQAQTLRRP